MEITTTDSEREDSGPFSSYSSQKSPQKKDLFQEEVKPAGFLRRAVAYVIDSFIVGFLFFMISIAGFVGMGLSSADSDIDFFIIGLPLFSGFFFIHISYFTFFHAVDGQTPAKIILRIKVVTLELKPLSICQSLFRTAGYSISSFFFGLGFLIAVIEKRKRALHDILSRTQVILTP